MIQITRMTMVTVCSMPSCLDLILEGLGGWTGGEGLGGVWFSGFGGFRSVLGLEDLGVMPGKIGLEKG